MSALPCQFCGGDLAAGAPGHKSGCPTGHGPRPITKTNDDTRLIPVCSACLRACCWQGEFMCDYAEGAGTVDKTVAELRAGQHGESEHYWTRLP